ncbi:MAG: hypothetical protein ACKOD2_18620, partial [Ilumatobacteraceae bacterium]
VGITIVVVAIVAGAVAGAFDATTAVLAFESLGELSLLATIESESVSTAPTIVVAVITDDSVDEDDNSSLAVVVIGESSESSDASPAPQPISSIAASAHPIRRTTSG